MMIRRAGGVLLAGLLLGASAGANAVPSLDLGNGTQVFSTGMDVAGSVDQRYRLTSIDGSPVDQDLSVVSAFFLSNNNADSQWIGHTGLSNAPNVVYGTSTVIDLTGFDLVNNLFSIAGSWISDNRGVDIRVNGVSTGQTNSGQHGQALWDLDPANAFSLDSATSGLIAGVNTVDFLWENGTPTFTAPSPTMVRIEFEEFSLVSPVPAPSVPLLFGVALIGFVRGARAGLR